MSFFHVSSHQYSGLRYRIKGVGKGDGIIGTTAASLKTAITLWLETMLKSKRLKKVVYSQSVAAPENDGLQ